ncbi:four-carbon acid sugar kinase family protein [Coprococcus catus]|uniref:four-carbon acid sugar kinase family protein n=1 Tax=Coprococcus catus TaxID=116085 RepID=UPI001C8CB4DC|nr:four-carbon acid sugar kinase family protein [Coprococcus catus]MBX9230788.1 four-carbon acid sugar kinase family protein [Coprococcus catus]MCT6799807.1 four-carbon acid sugar kinase family protein [Coprococcus catus]
MVKLLILADDFTGALDTGVQFSGKGIRTQVVVSGHWVEPDSDCDVIVIDVETRHVPKEKAYEIVNDVCQRAVKYGIRCFYKKTDSALRGNVGSELQAAADAVFGKNIVFVPAFPAMRRITVDGVHYIDGIPVKESVFGQDLFEPVMYDRVDELLRATGYRGGVIGVSKAERKLQTAEDWKTQASEERRQKAAEAAKQQLFLYDAETDADLDEIAEAVSKKSDIPILAGCAGFAAKLPELLKLPVKKSGDVKLKENLVFLCGSVNPITKSQIVYGEKMGIPRIHLKPEEKLEISYWDQPEGLGKIRQLAKDGMQHIIIDSNDEEGHNDTMEYAAKKGYSIEDVRVRISETLGYLLKKLIDAGMEATYLITGGDTLIGFMKAIGVSELEPVNEIRPGCVLTSLNYQDKKHYVITKSGGFGQERLIEQLTRILAQ